MNVAAISTEPHVRDFLAKLQRVRATGINQVEASCPCSQHAHGDRNPSLSIGVTDDGRILLNCHVGCTAADIVAALGLQMKDLYRPTNGNGHKPYTGNGHKPRKTYPTIDAAVSAARWGVAKSKRIDEPHVKLNGQWPYLDTFDAELMRVVRFDLPGGEKQYRPLHPVPGGYQIGDPSGLLPLYNLAAIAGADRVYLFEGEKCVDAAKGIGLAASTTTAHGANSFGKSDITPLADKEVVIVGDAGAAGENYVKEAVAGLLEQNPAARVKVVTLPDLADGEDVVEFIDNRRQSGVEADDDSFIREEIERMADAAPFELPPSKPGPMTFRELATRHQRMREAVIEGLLRVGETANIIASSKVGKSWLVLDLALAIASGRTWLGYRVTPGDVLIIDNELHPETISKRIPEVARARGIMHDEYADRLHVYPLRGRLQDLHSLRKFFDELEPGRFRLVILDAWYRLLPAETDENDNGSMAQLYNIADRLGCAFAVIHHASKGVQGGKAVTDVGAGAGSQSRAVDTHLVLRQHEEDGAIVLDAATRSWAPITPVCLRWTFPVWQVDEDLDPTRLRMERGRGGRPPKGMKEQIEEASAKAEPWTPVRFAKEFVTADPQTSDEIVWEARNAGLSQRDATSLLRAAIGAKLAIAWPKSGNNVPTYYANRPPTLAEMPSTAPKSSSRKGKGSNE